MSKPTRRCRAGTSSSAKAAQGTQDAAADNAGKPTPPPTPRAALIELREALRSLASGLWDEDFQDNPEHTVAMAHWAKKAHRVQEAQQALLASGFPAPPKSWLTVAIWPTTDLQSTRTGNGARTILCRWTAPQDRAGMAKIIYEIGAEIMLLAAAPPRAQAGEGAKAGAVDTPMTIIEFMRMFCTPLIDSLLRARRDSLQSAARRDELTLPPAEGKWKSGQSKKYRPSALMKEWPEYLTHLSSLPELKPVYPTKSASSDAKSA